MVVVASRGKFDEEAIEQALRAQSSYLGLMASPTKEVTELRLSLERKGEAAEKLAAICVPAGIDIGAETPEEIALERHGRSYLPKAAKGAGIIQGNLASQMRRGTTDFSIGECRNSLWGKSGIRFRSSH